jgi:hypothetical protein
MKFEEIKAPSVLYNFDKRSVIYVKDKSSDSIYYYKLPSMGLTYTTHYSRNDYIESLEDVIGNDKFMRFSIKKVFE